MFQEDRATEIRVNKQFADARAAAGAFLALPVDAPSKIPSFEGHVVHGTRAKLASASNIDLADESFTVDDMVTLQVMGKVTRVDYAVRETTGELFRVHTIKVLDASVSDVEQ